MGDPLLQLVQDTLDEAKAKYQSASDTLFKLNGQRHDDRKRIGNQRESQNGSQQGVQRISRPGGSVFDRLAAAPAKSTHVGVASIGPDGRTREAAIKELEAVENNQVKARNRRMFGMMLGTLRQFSAAEQTRQKQASYQQRQQVEEKVEAGVERSQEELQAERQQLKIEQRRRQHQITKLESKMRLLQTFNAWRSSLQSQRGSIRTTVNKPYRIFYLPRILCQRASRRHETSSSGIDDEIQTRQRQLELEIDLILKAKDEDFEADVEEDGEVQDARGRRKRGGSSADSDDDDDENKVSRNGRSRSRRSRSNGGPAPAKRLLSSISVVSQPQQHSSPEAGANAEANSGT